MQSKSNPFSFRRRNIAEKSLSQCENLHILSLQLIWTILILVYPRSMSDLTLHHVGNISRSQRTREAPSCNHRLQHLQTTLWSNSDISAGLLVNSDHQTVCRKPNRLCSYKRHSRGCSQHILLDSFNIHYPQCLLEAYRCVK